MGGLDGLACNKPSALLSASEFLARQEIPSAMAYLTKAKYLVFW